MIKNLLVSFTLLASSLLSALSAPVNGASEIILASPSSGGEPWGIQVLASGEHGAILELTVPPLEFSPDNTNGLPCQVVSTPGYASIGTPGWPDVPITGTSTRYIGVHLSGIDTRDSGCLKYSRVGEEYDIL